MKDRQRGWDQPIGTSIGFGYSSQSADCRSQRCLWWCTFIFITEWDGGAVGGYPLPPYFLGRHGLIESPFQKHYHYSGARQMGVWRGGGGHHFLHSHVRVTIVILKEGNQPYPICLKCDTFVSQWDLKIWHPSTEICQQVEYWKWRRLE